ncbi:PLAC8 family protein [Thraustotheca clavata]|uniref:PLAC8 family protein n=1 Tax=Thraustotheca clavata TaxID=74557 RepID=A0A1V9ZLT4_9STRA|nr:PLAC8 family protein [Thraustotheca clavata]
MQTPHESAPQVAAYNNDNNANGVTIGKWEAGIFSCFDAVVPNCLMSCCCPCFSLAQTTHRLGIYAYNKVLIAYGLLWLTMILCSVLAQVTIIFTIVQLVLYVVAFYFCFQIRTKVRMLLQIPGTQLEDCLYSFFCGCCSLAQMATQAKTYESGQCSFAAKDTLPAYNMV